MGHHHNHHHGHHHHAPKQFGKAFVIAISLNLIFTIVEACYAYIAHSTSLLADAGHNFGDVLSLLFAWAAMMMLKKDPNTSYSYGYKKTTILAALSNALILLLTCVLIAREAIEQFIHPHPILAIDVMVVAFIGILINGSTALLFMKGAKDDLNIKGAFLHLAYDALISFAVVVVAIVIYFTHLNVLDPIMGLLITGVIVWGTRDLLKQSLTLILDGVPQSINFTEVRNYLCSIEGIDSVHDLHIWSLSTQETALTAHLVAPQKLTDTQQAEIIHTLKLRFNIQHSTIQVEQAPLPDCGHCNHFEHSD